MRHRRGAGRGDRHGPRRGDLATIALAVALVFFFGYLLTKLPFLRFGLALGVVLPLASASDAISTAVMDVVDDAIIL